VGETNSVKEKTTVKKKKKGHQKSFTSVKDRESNAQNLRQLERDASARESLGPVFFEDPEERGECGGFIHELNHKRGQGGKKK